jgi:hypothetical protein
MRRGFWVVLGLVGAAPVGALAQEARQPGAGQAGVAPGTGTSLIIVANPEPQGWGSGGVGAGTSEPGRSGTGTGGSGRSAGAVSQAEATPGEEVPDDEVFIGTLRSVTGNRLRMVDPEGRVLEFDLGEQTRVIRFGDVPASLQALEEGTPVRAVTTEGDERNRVSDLLIYGMGPAPEE